MLPVKVPPSVSPEVKPHKDNTFSSREAGTVTPVLCIAQSANCCHHNSPSDRIRAVQRLALTHCFVWVARLYCCLAAAADSTSASEAASDTAATFASSLSSCSRVA